MIFVVITFPLLVGLDGKELGFKDKNIAEKFIDGASKLWPLWVSNEDKLAMQFLADTVKKMSEEKFLTKKDLYTLSEFAT